MHTLEIKTESQRTGQSTQRVRGEKKNPKEKIKEKREKRNEKVHKL